MYLFTGTSAGSNVTMQPALLSIAWATWTSGRQGLNCLAQSAMSVFLITSHKCAAHMLSSMSVTRLQTHFDAQ